VYESLIKKDEFVPDETTFNLASEITNRITQIAEQKAEIERIDQEVNLVKGERTTTAEAGKACVCGQELAFDAKFCAACGAPQPEQPEPVSEEPRADGFCVCGHALAEGAKFCARCGKPQ